MNAVIDYKGYPDDTLTISLNRQNVNVFTYYYDDFITLQYDKRSGGLVNINIEGITLLHDKDYNGYDESADTITCKLFDVEPAGCDFAYRDVEDKALISLDRDENGNLIGFEIVNVTKLMSGLLESSER
jgi:uncharacterized protein YuzE|tara:strand:+ start:153 stop:539 length:387 start_codon:yes stop_codon:yes gene_type:complete